MRTFTLLLCSVWVWPIHAGNQRSQDSVRSLRLSPGFELNWAKSLSLEILFTPSLGGFLLEGKESGKPFSVLTRHIRPEVFANPVSVRRFWRENVENTRVIGEKSKDHGCKVIRSYVFRCDRTAWDPAGKEHISETLIWNSDQDIVGIRVSSPVSQAHSDSVLSQFHFTLGLKR